METPPSLPKLLVEKHLQGLHIQLYGFKDNFEYLMLHADCCGQFIREKFPFEPAESLKDILDRAIEVSNKVFMQLAIIEVTQAKEAYGPSFVH